MVYLLIAGFITGGILALIQEYRVRKKEIELQILFDLLQKESDGLKQTLREYNK